jgi:hypothetical protein
VIRRRRMDLLGKGNNKDHVVIKPHMEKNHVGKEAQRN